MIEYKIRTKIQPFFDALGTFLMHYLSPNTITLCAFMSGMSAALCIAYNYTLIGLLLLWFSGLCDVLDGTVARLSNSAQKVGAYIDLIVDRCVEAAVIIGFTFLYPQHYFAYLLFVIGVLLHFSTFLAAGALFANEGNKSMHYAVSLVERAEAFIVFSLMLLFPGYIFELLMSFNLIIFYDAGMRFFRVVRLNKNLK